MKLDHTRILKILALPVAAVCIAAVAASCSTHAQTDVRELDALVAKGRDVEATITYRLSWNDGSPGGTLVAYNDRTQKTRVDLMYQRPNGAKAVRTLLLDGTYIYYCDSDSPPPGQAGPKDECVSHPMQSLQVEPQTASVRGITVNDRTTRTVGEKSSTCFNVERRGKRPAAWTECYALDGELTYADGDNARSLVESFGFQIPGHPVDVFSAVQSIEASAVLQAVDAAVFQPPYPVVEGQ